MAIVGTPHRGSPRAKADKHGIPRYRSHQHSSTAGTSHRDLELDSTAVRTGSCVRRKLRVRCEPIDLDVNVLLAPDEGNSRQPVLLLDCLASAGPVFGRQYERSGLEFRASDFTSNTARSDSHLGLVPDALVFARIASSHHVNFVVIFPEPDRGRHGDPTLTEGHKADVFLALNLAGDGHGDIVRAVEVRGCRKRDACR